MKQLIIILCMLMSAHGLPAQILTETVTVRFPVSRAEIVGTYMENDRRLDIFGQRIDSLRMNQKYSLKSVSVCGCSSPEGSYIFNQWLSGRRAGALLSRIRSILHVPDSIVSVDNRVCDWSGLFEAVRSDSLVPDRKVVLAMLRPHYRDGNDTAASIRHSDILLQKLHMLDGGRAYRYMLVNMFPALREATLQVTYGSADSIPRPQAKTVIHRIAAFPNTLYVQSRLCEPARHTVHNVTWALRTNLLFDALATPNIGAELYLGHNFSIQCEWMYAWWSHRCRNFFWRIYGGDIGVRWWFGGIAARQPLAGHHVGVYAQALIWDFEFGGHGYMGGVPGGAIWDRANLGAGIEYGYSMPVTERLNIDFCIGIGYIGGACREYTPQCGYYVWQSTRQLNYVGPTKLDISLVHTF